MSLYVNTHVHVYVYASMHVCVCECVCIHELGATLIIIMKNHSEEMTFKLKP